MADVPTPIWGFYDSVCVDRAKRLLEYEHFDKLIGRLRVAVITDFAWERFESDRLKGCHRAAFLLKVPEQVYDYFFNAPAEYRGQYAIDPAVGEAANRAVVSALEPSLLAFAGTKVVPAEVPVAVSLRATDAKVWIYEREVDAQLGDDSPAIRYAPWEKASETGVGLLAPKGTRLEIKGGWLDDQGREHRDPFKTTRGTDIHCTGYS